MTQDDRRHRDRLLFVVLSVLRLHAPGDAEPGIVRVLRQWLDSWGSIGLVATGMARQGFDLQLTRYGDEGWRATFYPAGRANSPTSAVGHSLGSRPERRAGGIRE